MYVRRERERKRDKERDKKREKNVCVCLGFFRVKTLNTSQGKKKISKFFPFQKEEEEDERERETAR